MRKGKISDNVIRRLPRYLRKLDEMSADGYTRISSKVLGDAMGLTPSQIRQDLSCFGDFGQQGYGYNIASLRGEIANILAINRRLTAVLVGVGNIGQALAEHFSFALSGIQLIDAFDIRPEVVGTQFGNLTVKNADALEQVLDERHPDIAILCVSQESANETADFLVDHGILGIWNFTNVELTQKAKNVIVENLHFTDSLLVLSYYLSEKQKGKTAAERSQNQQ